MIFRGSGKIFHTLFYKYDKKLSQQRRFMQSVVGRNSLSSTLPLCPQIVPLRLCSSALAAQLLIAGDSLGTKVAPLERGGAWGGAGVVAGLGEGVQKKKKKKFATLL